MYRLAACGSGYRPVAPSCEEGNVSPLCIKGREFRDKLSDCKLLKKNSVLWSLSAS